MGDQILSDAIAAAEALDLQYTQADFLTKLQLKPMRDAAFEAVESARRRLVGRQVSITSENVAEMGGIRTEIERAAETESLIVGAGKLVAFLSKMAPVV